MEFVIEHQKTASTNRSSEHGNIQRFFFSFGNTLMNEIIRLRKFSATTRNVIIHLKIQSFIKEDIVGKLS